MLANRKRPQHDEDANSALEVRAHLHPGFLVEISTQGRSRPVLWNPEEELHLDFPLSHTLRMRDQDLVVVELASGERKEKRYRIPQQAIEQGVWFDVCGLSLRIRELKRSRAAYLPAAQESRAGEVFASSGSGETIESFDPVGGKYVGRIGGATVFTAVKTASGMSFLAKAPGVNLQFEELGIPRVLAVGASTPVADQELSNIVIRSGQHWWRFSRVQSAVMPEVERRTALDVDPEIATFKKISKWVGGAFSVVLVAAWLMSPSGKKEEKKEVKTIVQLKAPKIIHRKPEPKKVVQAQPKPKAPEKKIVQKKAPAKKVAQKKPQPRPVARKAAPAPKVARKPVQKRQPLLPNRRVVNNKPVAPPKPTAAQVRAQAQARAAKSLNFLSGALGRASKAPVAVNNNAAARRYDSAAAPVANARGGGNMLGKMANAAAVSDGPITTNSARGMSSDTGVTGGYGAGGKGKALNEVQGRVSLAALYDANAGESMGSSLGGGGLTMSGQGSIPEGLLMKILSKHLDKFQYCYEKALLTNASLGGNVMMQWTIAPGGKASSPKVVQSQLNHSGLHHCVASELLKIRFPSPSGGAVTIKYPFTFTSSSL